MYPSRHDVGHPLYCLKHYLCSCTRDRSRRFPPLKDPSLRRLRAQWRAAGVDREARHTHACGWRVGTGDANPLHPPVIRKQYGKDPDGQVVPVHHLPGGTRGTRTSAAPEVARAHLSFQLAPTLGPSTCSTNPSRSTHRPARITPFY